MREKRIRDALDARPGHQREAKDPSEKRRRKGEKKEAQRRNG